MKFTIATMTCVLALSMAAIGQQVATPLSIEKEALQFAESYDEAILKRDVAFLERHLDEAFISLGPNSQIMTRAEAIEQNRRPVGVSAFTVIETKSAPIKIVVSGDTVIISSNWLVNRKANSVQNAPIQTDRGSTTAVYRKSDIWKLVYEHVSFNMPSDENEIGAIGRLGATYNRALVLRNYADLESMLAPNFQRIDESGVQLNRSQFLSDLRSGKLVVTSLRHKNVYVTRREAIAIETGLFSMEGTNNNAAFNKIVEYTRKWVKSGDTWKASAEYFSVVGQ